MHREDLAAERPRDPLLVVEEDVEREVDPGRRGDRPDGVVDGVALDDAPGRARVADPAGVVQLERRLEPGEARRDHLRAAAEAGEEVRLDEAGRDPEVRLDPLAVQGDGDVADHPEVDQARGSRASWSTTRQVPSTSSPSIARRSSSDDARCVPVAMRTTTSSGRMMPSRTSMMRRSISGRGWGRVTSHTEIATRWPGRTTSRSGGPATGRRWRRAASPAGRGPRVRGRGAMTVVWAAGRRTVSPVDP